MERTRSMRSLSEIWRKMRSEEVIQGEFGTHHNRLVIIDDAALDDDFAVFPEDPRSR